MSVLESIGAAMPGVGFIIGGLVTSVFSPRMTFLVAGVGVFAIVAIMAPLLGSKWPERAAKVGSGSLDGDNDVVLELIPGSRPVQSNPEVLP
jgi:hypothetical protein